MDILTDPWFWLKIAVPTVLGALLLWGGLALGRLLLWVWRDGEEK